MLSVTDGYKISKPTAQIITHILYVDDLKIYAASEEKLKRVAKKVKSCMSDVGLEWNDRKCAAAHVKSGNLQINAASKQNYDVISGVFFF